MTATEVVNSARVVPTSLRKVPSEQATLRVRDLVEYHVLANATPATQATVIRDLTTPDLDLLGRGDGLPAAVAQALVELVQSGHVVEVPGGYAPYALSADISRCVRTLSLCGRAVMMHGRGVRASEVWQYATTFAPGDVHVGALTRKRVVHDLLSLTASKRLRAIGSVRGATQDGRKLLVPSRWVTDASSWVPTEPITWLDYGVEAMRRMLGPADRNMFTAKELRAFLEKDIEARQAEGRATPVGNTSSLRVRTALVSLAESREPVVRQVPGRDAVWMLVGPTPKDEASVVAEPYATESDRVVEAARRVTQLSRCPVVNASDLRDAILADPQLALSGITKIADVLADLAKERVDCGNRRRVARRTQRVRKVGVMHGSAVYWVATGIDDDERLEAARRLVECRGVNAAVTRGRFVERIAALENAHSPIIATGRARQLLREIEDLSTRVHALPRETEELANWLGDLERHANTLLGWLSFRSARGEDIPTEVQHEPPGLTARTLRNLFAPLNAMAASLKVDGSIIQHYQRAIRRVPNPRFVGRRSGDPATAAQYLFDQVDAIAYAARQWGGPKCQLHTFWAVEELGDLRDARYVRAALATGTTSIRQRVMGTLALLQPPDAVELLTNHARNDVNPGVRECALWALGHVLKDAATPLLTEVIHRDPDASVRRTAKGFIAIGDCWWWRA